MARKKVDKQIERPIRTEEEKMAGFAQIPPWEFEVRYGESIADFASCKVVSKDMMAAEHNIRQLNDEKQDEFFDKEAKKWGVTLEEYRRKMTLKYLNTIDDLTKVVCLCKK